MTRYKWNQDNIESCLYKEDGVNNSYYVLTKLAVQKWRHALRKYTGNEGECSITIWCVHSETELESCDIKFYIYNKNTDSPNYPRQVHAYPRHSMKARISLICAYIFDHLYYMALALPR